MLFKNPVRTSKRTPHFTFTTINWLTLFKEIIVVYNERNPHTQHAASLNVRTDGTYSYRLALKGWAQHRTEWVSIGLWECVVPVNTAICEVNANYNCNMAVDLNTFRVPCSQSVARVRFPAPTALRSVWQPAGEDPPSRNAAWSPYAV
jgi:hypothetical protein